MKLILWAVGGTALAGAVFLGVRRLRDGSAAGPAAVAPPAAPAAAPVAGGNPPPAVAPSAQADWGQFIKEQTIDRVSTPAAFQETIKQGVTMSTLAGTNGSMALRALNTRVATTVKQATTGASSAAANAGTNAAQAVSGAIAGAQSGAASAQVAVNNVTTAAFNQLNGIRTPGWI